MTVDRAARALPRGPLRLRHRDDRQLGIPGEDLPGSHSATEFVNWYNAHPDFADREFDLSAERVVVIGNGNVAADVARMLALPREELETTDTADHAIEALAESGVTEIVVLGRRGPAQAAFTNPEVRELGEMTQADVIIDPADMELDEQPATGSTPRTATRPTAATSRSSPSSPSASRRARSSGSSCASSPPPSRSRATARSRDRGGNELRRGGRLDPRQGHGRARDDRLRPGAAVHRLQGRPIEGAPFDESRA